MKSILCIATVLLTLASTAQSSDGPHFVGLNIPWNYFGYDIGAGAFNQSWFSSYFQNAMANKHNIARFWLHPDGRAGLDFDTNGAVTGFTNHDQYLEELETLVQLAYDNNIVLQICLWSFDMCQDHLDVGYTRSNIISNPVLTDSYINNALRPMLIALESHENVIIEVINEPEWCMNEAHCQTEECVSAGDMQRFVAAISHAVHDRNDEYNKLVTVGSASLKWHSNDWPGEAFYWSDAALNAASSLPVETVPLDLYNVHYFDWMHQWQFDPMWRDIDAWGLGDKLTVVGELPASSNHYTTADLLSKPYDNDFAGSIFWAYNDGNYPIDAAIPEIINFVNAHPTETSYSTVVDYMTTTARDRMHPRKG